MPQSHIERKAYERVLATARKSHARLGRGGAASHYYDARNLKQKRQAGFLGDLTR